MNKKKLNGLVVEEISDSSYQHLLQAVDTCLITVNFVVINILFKH